jgi:transposase
VGLGKETPQMDIMLSPTQRADLEAAAASERRARVWRRYRAVLLLGDGHAPAAVVAALGCSLSSVYGWAATWRRDGLAGLRGQPHSGGVVPLAARAGAVLATLLEEDPQTRGHHATGWTVPLLRTELASAGYAVSAKTIRRALHRLDYRWKRPKYVLGRPDPAYAEKKRP